MSNQNRGVFPVTVTYRVLFFIMGGTILWWGLGEKDHLGALNLTVAIFVLSEISIHFFTRSKRKALETGFNDPVRDTPDINEGNSFRSLPNTRNDKAPAAKSREPELSPNSSSAQGDMKLQKNSEQEKQFFQKILDSAFLYSFIVISMDGKVESWNSGAENLFGWSKKEAIGRPVSFTFIKDDTGKAAQIQRKRSKQVMTEGKAVFNMTRRRKNGEQFPVHCTVTALKDKNGKVEGFLEIGRDLAVEVKKDRALQEQIQTAHNLTKSLKKIEGIVKSIELITLQTNILAINAAVEAARAGEAGAGFAVISEEIRTLSNNSSNAAQEIGQLVVEIRGESRKITETQIDWIQID